MIKHLFSILLFISQWCYITANAQHTELTSYKNIIYKVSGQKDSLALDLFLPEKKANNSKIPVVMIIHGGAWVMGNRSLDTIAYMKKLRAGLNKNGFAVISIDYTLVNKTIHLPTPVDDCRDAVRWVRANADKYNFDSDNIGLWGGSAGGHLALLIAYAKEQPQDVMPIATSAKVNYVIDNFGPTDLNKLLKTDASWFTILLAKIFIPKLLPIRNQLIFALTGYTLKADKAKVKEIALINSPLPYVDSLSVPTLILHGTKDNVVPLAQSKKLHETLTNFKVENELLIVKNGDHGFNNIDATETDSLVEKTIAFAINQGIKKATADKMK